MCAPFYKTLACAAMIIHFLFVPATAADGPEPTVKQLNIQIEIFKDQVAKLQKANSDLQKANSELGKPSIDTDRDLYAAWAQLKKNEYAYYSKLMESNEKTFAAQQVASDVVLMLVVLVVSAGLIFSGAQLWKGFKTGVQANTDLEVSAASVRVTSSVVGIVVLAISLAFLYIYAHEVYHIKAISATGADQSAPSLQQQGPSSKQ